MPVGRSVAGPFPRGDLPSGTRGTGEQGPLFTPSWTRDSVDCTRIGTLGETNAPFRTVTRTSIAIGLVITVGFLPSALMFS